MPGSIEMPNKTPAVVQTTVSQNNKSEHSENDQGHNLQSHPSSRRASVMTLSAHGAEIDAK